VAGHHPIYLKFLKHSVRQVDHLVMNFCLSEWKEEEATIGF